MKEYMDDLLREAFHIGIEMPEELERDVMGKLDTTEKQQRLWGTVSGGGRLRRGLVLAALCMVVLMGSAVTVYSAVNGLSVGQLFARIWGEGQQNTALKEISTEGKILSQKSAFEDISVEAVQVVSDGRVAYIVLKVEGRKGFRLTDEMSFNVFHIKNRQNTVESLESYVLKREGNTMYVALKGFMGSAEKSGKQKFTLGIYHLYHAVLDEMGRCAEVKNIEEGKNSVRYTEKSIAARGEYHAEISCTIQDRACKISTEEFGNFEVRALSVIVDKDMAEEAGLVDTKGRDNKVYIIMEDGSKVPAELCGGMEETSTEFELREPIDVKKVRGIRVMGKVYE